jgi:vitamin K-dependent gamma-carboxylase
MMATDGRRSLQRALLRPVDAASLAAFRMLFGLAMLALVLRFFAHGWIAEYFLQPRFFFPYFGFEWLRPWPGVGMYLHFAALGVLALSIAAGAFYRASVLLFTLLFAYAHLIDKTNYLNHYYLLICLGLLMSVLPLQRLASLDAWRRPQLRSSTVPAWVLYVLRAQFGLVYFFGGIAKLKSDWIVDAQPLRIWLSANSDFPVLGSFFDLPWVAHVASYAGAAFDLSIVPLLLWRRSRPLAYVALLLFHVITARLFQLGMFPWIMLLGSLLFLPPDWPRQLLGRLGWHASAASVPSERTLQPAAPRWLLALIGTHLAVQALLPLRHWLYPGNVCWTEQGFRFAWNVMLMEKDGAADFRVLDPASQRRWVVAPTDYLTRYQAKMMASQPDMILQFAHVLAEDFRAGGVLDPQVFVDAHASLNGRRSAALIDPRVDLARQSDGWSAKTWILPLPSDRASNVSLALQSARP